MLIILENISFISLNLDLYMKKDYPFDNQAVNIHYFEAQAGLDASIPQKMTTHEIHAAHFSSLRAFERDSTSSKELDRSQLSVKRSSHRLFSLCISTAKGKYGD